MGADDIGLSSAPVPGEFEGKVFITYPDVTEVELENINGDSDSGNEGSSCTLGDTGAVTFFVYGTDATTFTLYSTGLLEDDDTGDSSCKLTFFWTITVE